jgi:hydrogenase maturation factor
MAGTVFSNLGWKSGKVLVGPGVGLDNAIISAGNGKVLLLTTDPVSMIPRLGPQLSAWLSVHLIASDYATSGLSPEFAAFDFNFPPDMSPGGRRSYTRAMGSACKELGIAIVAGHTGSYPGAGFTVIGGGMMFGFCDERACVNPSMARPGDTVVMTKGAAIEAVASLATSFPRYTATEAGTSIAEKATRLISACSTVKDALTAATVGLGKEGITSMHDATEGGVLGGLEEMAEASGHSMIVDKGTIPVSQEAAAVCAVFGIDPLTSLSEGTLLVTVNPRKVDELVEKMRSEGISAVAIGTVSRGVGLWVTGRNGHRAKVRHSADMYWKAYARATYAGLD